MFAVFSEPAEKKARRSLSGALNVTNEMAKASSTFILLAGNELVVGSGAGVALVLIIGKVKCLHLMKP